MAPWLLGLGAPASAGHGWPQSYGTHLHSIHYDWKYEEYCYESYASGVTPGDLRTKLGDTIYGKGWDGTGSWRINDIPTSTNCDSIPDAGNWVDMVYLAQDSVPCGSGGAYVTGNSCQQFLQPVYSGSNIVHWWQSLVYLAKNNITGTSAFMHAVISHETGHTFGLQDPPDSSGNPSDPICTRGGWWFGSSVNSDTTDVPLETSSSPRPTTSTPL